MRKNTEKMRKKNQANIKRFDVSKTAPKVATFISCIF